MIKISKFQQAVNAAQRQIKEVTLEQALQLLQNNPHALLIDTREDNEWEKGHLPNAIHLGKGVIERDIEMLVTDNDRPMVLYCGGGFRSALATLSLQNLGYTNVMSMSGGFRAWIEADLPIEQ